MEKIKLLKVELVELNVLKNELLTFYQYHENRLRLIDKNDIDNLVIQLLQVDSARNLYFNFGNKIVTKIKNHGKSLVNFTITVTEAVILIYACSMQNSLRNDYETFVCRKFVDKIHELLINLI